MTTEVAPEEVVEEAEAEDEEVEEVEEEEEADIKIKTRGLIINTKTNPINLELTQVQTLDVLTKVTATRDNCIIILIS